MADIAWVSLLGLAVALAGAGFVSGLLAGLFGIGGGAVVVLTLYEAFAAVGVDPDVRMHLATGTALAVIAPTTLRSFRAHRQRGTVDLALLKRLAPVVLIGVVLGIVFAKGSEGSVLKWVWVVMGSLLSLRMFLGRDDWRLGDDIPRSKLVELYGVFVGFVSTLMSIGGGAFMTILMTLYGRSLHQAVATSAGLGPVIAIPGMIGFAWAGWGEPGLPFGSLGYVSLIGAALVVPTGLLGAPLGARLAHGLSKRTLELAFATFMSFVVLRFFASLAF